jgi:hypothetical protein
MSYSDSWVTWEEGESQFNLGDWTIRALDTNTNKQFQLGSSKLPDGTFLSGQLAFPVTGHGYVAWPQPTSSSSVDLRIYRLDTGTVSTLDSGKLSSPVFAGRNLVWAKYSTVGGEPSIQMADADTLQPVAVPTTLVAPRPIVYLAGSPDYLAWTENLSKLVVAELSSGRQSTYAFSTNAMTHPFQFPMIVGHFLVWPTGYTNTVLDLHTGGAIEINLPGAVAGSNDVVVAAQIQAGIKGSVTATTVSTIHLTQESDIPPCPHR